MSPGKLAAQVSSAFLIEKAKELGMIEGVDYFPIVESPQGTLTYGGREDWERFNILVLSLLMYQNTSNIIVLLYFIAEYIEIRRRNLKIVIRKRKWFSRF